MSIYFTDGQIPELAGLKAAQRRAVRRGAYYTLFKEHPSARWITGVAGGIGGGTGTATGILLSRLLPKDSNYWLVVYLLSALVVGGFAGFIGVQLLIKRVRPYFRRYIEEHRDELSRTV